MAKAEQFKKNDPRINRDGKKPGTLSLVTKMREALNEMNKSTKKPYHELFVQSVLNDAIRKDGPSRKIVMQYLEGMPKQVVELQGKDGGDLFNNEQKETGKKAVGKFLKKK